MGLNGRRCEKLNRQRCGFTLVELMAVTVVIAVLVGIILGTTKAINRQSSYAQARNEMVTVALAIDRFRSDNGRYPTSSVVRISYSGLAEITNSALLYAQLTQGSKRYLNPPAPWCRSYNSLTYLVDPWGKAFNYFCTYPVQPAVVSNGVSNLGYVSGGQMNLLTYDLFSYGPDGITYVLGGIWTAWGNNSKWYDPLQQSDADDVTNWKPRSR